MPVIFPAEIVAAVNNSLADGNPMVLAVVTSEQKPVLSFRGSTQTLSDHELCLWKYEVEFSIWIMRKQFLEINMLDERGN